MDDFIDKLLVKYNIDSSVFDSVIKYTKIFVSLYSNKFPGINEFYRHESDNKYFFDPQEKNIKQKLLAIYLIVSKNKLDKLTSKLIDSLDEKYIILPTNKFEYSDRIINEYLYLRYLLPKNIKWKGNEQFIPNMLLGCGTYGCVYSMIGSNYVAKIILVDKSDNSITNIINEYKISKYAADNDISPKIIDYFDVNGKLIFKRDGKVDIRDAHYFIFVFERLDITLREYMKNYKEEYEKNKSKIQDKINQLINKMNKLGIYNKDIHDENIMLKLKYSEKYSAALRFYKKTVKGIKDVKIIDMGLAVLSEDKNNKFILQ
jgi:hypothetical protein